MRMGLSSLDQEREVLVVRPGTSDPGVPGDRVPDMGQMEKHRPGRGQASTDEQGPNLQGCPWGCLLGAPQIAGILG